MAVLQSARDRHNDPHEGDEDGHLPNNLCDLHEERLHVHSSGHEHGLHRVHRKCGQEYTDWGWLSILLCDVLLLRLFLFGGEDVRRVKNRYDHCE